MALFFFRNPVPVVGQPKIVLPPAVLVVGRSKSDFQTSLHVNQASCFKELVEPVPKLAKFMVKYVHDYSKRKQD